MSDSEVQRKILEVYYEKWKDFSRYYSAKDIKIDGVEKETILVNAQFLVKKGMLEKARTLGFLTKITVHGIDFIEDQRLSEEVGKRRRILEVINDEFEKEPRISVWIGKLIERTGYNDVELNRNIWYLEGKGFVKVSWTTNGASSVEITRYGIEALKQPSALEKEVKVMSNAYSILYQLENGLRIFMEKKLREVFDANWWERGVTPNDIRERADARKASEQSNLSLINYTEFGDLGRIIVNNWKIFEPVFKTQKGVISRLEELEPLRNKIAHSRLLSNHELEKLNLFFKEITDFIT